ncbi:MAG: hypothetical protein Q9228_002169, partial [Teloschistes exilis]
MPRARQTSSSESDREEPDASPLPPRRRQTVPQHVNAGPPPGRQGPRRGSAPGTYPDNDDDDDDDTDGEEPKPPSRGAGALRGGRARPIQRQAAPNDDDSEDNSPSPLIRNTTAGRGGRGGRGSRGGRAGQPRPISIHVRSDDDTLDADRSDYGTPPPRRRASTVSGRRPNDGEIGSPGQGQRVPNPRRRHSPSPVTFSPIEPDSPTEDLEVRSPGRGRGRRPPNPRQRQRSPSPVNLSPIEPDSPTEDWDDDLRKALAVSQAEPQPVRPSEDDNFEEQLRQVMKASSKAEAAVQKKRAAKQSNDEEQLRRLMEWSEKEHREQERARVRREREEARRQEEEFERALRESQRAAAAQRSDHLEEEDTELERAIRLSQVTHNADVRKAAERMAGRRATAPQSPSWTEGKLQSGGHQEESVSTAATPLSAPV